MKPVLVLVLVFVVACASGCGPAKEPPATSSSSSSSSGAATACGELGGSCAKEGAMCTPVPIGTGWSHMLHCAGGKWRELEIAPLPQPPPTPSNK